MAGIAATVAIPLLLETAGDVDRGATVAQYLGSSLLTGSFIAIGLFTSGITRNQIVAFIIGVTANFFLLAIGLDTFLLAVPSSVAAVLQGLSPLTHFEKIARGVLDMRDMVYFLALILTFLSGAYFMLRRKTLSHRSPLYNNLQVGFVALVVLSLLTGWFGGAIHGRLDLTDEKLYTLSPSTEAILSDLDDVLTLHLYASKDLPTHVSLVRRDVGDFLEDLGAQSDRVRVVHSFPDEDDDAEAWAQQIGIQPVEVQPRGGGGASTQARLLRPCPHLSGPAGDHPVHRLRGTPGVPGGYAGPQDVPGKSQDRGLPHRVR